MCCRCRSGRAPPASDKHLLEYLGLTLSRCTFKIIEQLFFPANKTRGVIRIMQHHQGVQTLLGEPKKAILRLSIPMIIAMAAQSIYNLADAIWVSGIPGTGNQALSAVGFFFPYHMLTMALAIGIGSGGGAAISRRIGSRDPQGAGSVAVHTIIIMLLTAGVLTALFLLFQRSLFTVMGAREALDSALQYSTVMFGATILTFFTNIANSLMRSEGNVHKAMNAILIGALLNIILDPLFIFTRIPFLPFDFGLGLGVAGAAWASALSMLVSSVFLFKWLFIDKNNYVKFDFKGFRFHPEYTGDIIRVGLPSSLSQAAMALMNFILLIFISKLSDNDGVAVFTAGWRILMLAILPLIGMATAVTSVSGAAFGAGAYDKLKTSHSYAVTVGSFIEIALAVVTFIFAPQIVSLFTYTEATRSLAPAIVIMLRILCLFFPSVAGGMLSSAMFEGTGHGIKSLLVTILRTVILGVFFAWLLAFVLRQGVEGVYYGIVLGSWIASAVAFTWGRIFIHSLQHPPKS